MGVAPGRVNLIGEHVDYEGGLVLPMAIDRWVAVAFGEHDQPIVRGVTASASGETCEQATGERQPDGPWVKYVAGVLDGYRQLGWEAGGASVAVASTLPAGAGLSSSAALETATAVAMEDSAATTLSPKDRALLCQKAEHEFAGVPCGIMDQLTVGCAREGHALSIDCRSLDWEAVALPEGFAVLVVDTGVGHELGESEYPKRRAECREAADLLGVDLLSDADPSLIEKRLPGNGLATVRNRARHVVNEIGRVRKFAIALENNDREGIARTMAGSHDSLRDLYEVSCDELDALVTIGRDLDGVVGCRMTGGGFGGSVVMLVEADAGDAVEREIVLRYAAATGLEAATIRVKPVDGAEVVETEKLLEA